MTNSTGSVWEIFWLKCVKKIFYSLKCWLLAYQWDATAVTAACLLPSSIFRLKVRVSLPLLLWLWWLLLNLSFISPSTLWKRSRAPLTFPSSYAARSRVLLTWIKIALDLLVQAFNQLIQPHNTYSEMLFCVLVCSIIAERTIQYCHLSLCSFHDSQPFTKFCLFSLQSCVPGWIIAISLHIAHHPACSVAPWELIAVAALVSRPASVSKSLPGCYWQLNHHGGEQWFVY